MPTLDNKTNRFDAKKMEIQRRIEASKRALILDFQELKDDLNPLSGIKNSIKDFTQNMADFNPFSTSASEQTYFTIQNKGNNDAEKGRFTISDNHRLNDNIERAIAILKPLAMLSIIVWLKHDKINLKNYVVEGMRMWNKDFQL